ncbi:MAG: acetate--CoA ligase family protein [Salinirussus sp.]
MAESPSLEQLRRMFDPGAVAVAGASTDERKRGHIAMRCLADSEYDGDIYPVNPSAGSEILGRTVYPSVSAIPDRVDLVYVVTPAGAVASVLEDAGEAGVAGAVVFSAGFSEAGNDEAEAELVRIAEEYDIRFLGPNVIGMVNTHADLSLGIDADYSPGGLATISQSGNLGMTLGVELNRARNTGLSHLVAIGNESDLTFQDLLPYFRSTETTDALALYVEGMSDGRGFLPAAKRFAREKPIVALKGGRTGAGRASAQSHTASLAGDAGVVDAVYRQAGVATVEAFEDLVPVAQALTELPVLAGRRIAILTEAGGVATVAADALVEHGLTVPDLTAETRERLRDLFPHAPNVSNPVDTSVTPETASKHGDAAEALLGDPNVDGLLICGSYGGYGVTGHGIELPTDDASASAQLESARRLTGLPGEYDKPVVVKSTFTPAESEALAICREGGIPVYTAFRHVPLAFEALAEYGEFLRTAGSRTDFGTDSVDDRWTVDWSDSAAGRALSEYETREVLADRGIPVAPYRLATSPAKAVEAAATFDGPVAMKVVSADIQHKTEAGGVSLDVAGERAVRETYDELVRSVGASDPEAAIDGVLVSPMVDTGVEVIVGATRDDEVGPVILFGLGGVFVEVLDDVTFGAVPLTEYDARRMIEGIENRAMLTGVRGSAGVDERALVDLLCDTSELVAANPEIAELDLNPVACHEDGIAVLDASIRL